MEKSPYFFKIILQEAIRHGRLSFPKKFITKYGNGLSSPVTLEVPSGATWQVELSNRDGEVCLENGWQEFAKFHRLAHGHLLMFKFEQPRHFHVLIFDQSATEIDYPSRPISTSEQNLDGGSKEPKSEENDDKNSVEILDYPSANLERGEEPLSPPSRKKRRTAPTNKTANTAASKSLLGNFRNLKAPSAVKKEFRGNFNKKMHKKKASLALEAANKHISESDYPSFKSVVRCRKNDLNMCAPVGFSCQYFGKKVNDLTFRVADRNWPVRLLLYAKKKFTSFTCGLPVFGRENFLKQGDVCAFELIESRVLNVCIFRRSVYDAFSEENDDKNSVEIMDYPSSNLEGGEEPLSPPPRKKMRTAPTNKTANTAAAASKSLLGNVRNLDFPSSSKKEFRGNFNKRMHEKKASQTLEAANKYISESDHPSFKSVVRYRRNGLTMWAPLGFSHQYFGKKVNDLTFQVADRNWPVRLLQYDKNKYTRFASGLPVFGRENSLKQGDVCVFELIESGVLNVCIFRLDD